MRVTTRLFLGNLALTAIVAALAVVAISGLRSISRARQAVQVETLPTLNALDELRFAGLRVVSSSNETALILTQTKGGAAGAGAEEGRMIREGRRRYRDAQVRYTSLVSRDDSALAVQLQQAGVHMLVVAGGLVEAAGAGRGPGEIIERREVLEQAEAAFLTAVQAALDSETREFEVRSDGVESEIAGVSRAILLLSVLLIALAVGVGAHLDRTIARHLRTLVAAARELAAGRLAARVPASGPDELAQLARSFNEMADALDRSFAEVRRSEANQRDLVTHAPLGIARVTPEGVVTSANPALAALLGYDGPDAVVGAQLPAAVFRNGNEGGAALARFLAPVPPEGLECAWQRRDGRPITVRLSGRAVRSESNAVTAIELIIEDVTERHDLEEQLRQAQKMEAVGQLSGGIAHDLNNTLTVIQANADLVMGALPPGDAEAHADLLELQAAAHRGAKMIANLLAFSRRQQLAMRSLDIGNVVRELAGTLLHLLPASIAVEVDVEPGLPAIEADAGAIGQVLVNLATNARDAMPGGGTLRIEVRRRPADAAVLAAHGVTHHNDYLCLIVTDTGFGMDQRTRSQIFEPFFTTKEQGTGTGLGMAMVYGLIRQHEGFVSVYSEPGRGTTVRVYLPIRHANAETDEIVDAPLPRGGSETILVVDDEKPLRRAARKVLERFGYTVLDVADGAAALELLRAGEPPVDLVLSDVVMPHMGGFELVEALRGEGRAPRILLSSGYTGSDVAGRAELDPTVPFLPKPWTLPELLAAVRAALDREIPQPASSTS